MGYLIIKRSDGGVSVRSPIAADADHAAEVADWEARPRSKKEAWTVVSYRYSETNPMPSDRSQRNAFVDDGESIKVDPAR